MVLVSIVDRRGAEEVAASDLDMVEQALDRVTGSGVDHGPVEVVVLHDDALARELVSPRAAHDACTAGSWRRAVAAARHRVAPSAAARPAVVIVVGGTIASPVPFSRRAGLTCPGRPPVVLFDRRPVPGVDRAVVLLHELGHAAGLAHRGRGAGRRPRAGGCHGRAADPRSWRAVRRDCATSRWTTRSSPRWRRCWTRRRQEIGG